MHRLGKVVLDVKTEMSSSTLAQINENQNKISSNAIQVIRADSGSLVIWTRMSEELFESNDFFIEKLRLFLKHFFRNSGIAITDMCIDVKVQIAGK